MTDEELYRSLVPPAQRADAGASRTDAGASCAGQGALRTDAPWTDEVSREPGSARARVACSLLVLLAVGVSCAHGGLLPLDAAVPLKRLLQHEFGGVCLGGCLPALFFFLRLRSPSRMLARVVHAVFMSLSLGVGLLGSALVRYPNLRFANVADAQTWDWSVRAGIFALLALAAYPLFRWLLRGYVFCPGCRDWRELGPFTRSRAERFRIRRLCLQVPAAWAYSQLAKGDVSPLKSACPVPEKGRPVIAVEVRVCKICRCGEMSVRELSHRGRGRRIPELQRIALTADAVRTLREIEATARHVESLAS